MDNFLVNNCDLENISFSKPKKHGDYLVCKVCKVGNGDNDNNNFLIQFPKMKINSINSKNIELEFLDNTTKYNKEVYNFLASLDNFIMDLIVNNSEEWFNKIIPVENINQMYNKFIKAPNSTTSECTLNFALHKELKLTDKKNNSDMELSDYKENSQVECISQLKYLIFSKDTCFTVWEVRNMKLINKRVHRVPKFAFIEDFEEPVPEDPDDFVAENYSFF